MNESDFRLALLNATAFTISMAHVEMALKLMLLMVSIGYTLQRWYLLRKDKAKK
jgi:hypothetical protein